MVFQKKKKEKIVNSLFKILKVRKKKTVLLPIKFYRNTQIANYSLSVGFPDLHNAGSPINSIYCIRVFYLVLDELNLSSELK